MALSLLFSNRSTSKWDWKIWRYKPSTSRLMAKRFIQKEMVRLWKEFFTNSQVWLYQDSLIHYISFGWNMTMDIKQAFLTSNLEENIYMM